MIQVGQKVYLRSNSRHSFVKTGQEETIEKVGKKFAYLSNRTRFFIDTMKHDGGQYTSRYTVYLSIDELNAEVEYERMVEFISMVFRHSVRNRFSSKAIKSIYDIIKSEEEDEQV